ncbi:MAG: exodeoxyribonuclease VII small subunit [Myxococcales bacterium]|nr:exodeoxyribonuclease VII small subunit [Myxococcales bacterium]
MSRAKSAEGETETFEASTERLAGIVEELERGDLPLERSLLLFEEGVRLARMAQAKIEQAERRVEELLGFDTEGRPVTRTLSKAKPGGAPAGEPREGE